MIDNGPNMVVDLSTGEGITRARRILARQECDAYGHSYDTIQEMGEPRTLLCSRCGANWKVSSPDA